MFYIKLDVRQGHNKEDFATNTFDLHIFLCIHAARNPASGNEIL